jgi:hypothetical protein
MQSRSWLADGVAQDSINGFAGRFKEFFRAPVLFVADDQTEVDFGKTG